MICLSCNKDLLRQSRPPDEEEMERLRSEECWEREETVLFSSYRYDEAGKLQEVINAEMALDIPVSKEIKLMKPRVHTHDENQNTWVASADRGVMRKDNSLVLLKENVLVMNKNTRSKVETSEINFDLQKRVAETKKQVAVSHVEGFTIADGMKVDLKGSKLQLDNQVRTTYFNDND